MLREFENGRSMLSRSVISYNSELHCNCDCDHPQETDQPCSRWNVAEPSPEPNETRLSSIQNQRSEKVFRK